MSPEQSGPNPYFFLVGSYRSGTTLLSRIAEAHSCILGYPRGCPFPAPAAWERAAQLRERFARGLAERGEVAG
jgi:hypothetical protein